MSLRTVVLRLIFLLCCRLDNVFAVNNTVLDTNPSIVYSPMESWHPSSNLCSTCLDPGNSTSFHEAIHPALNLDPDDFSSTSSSSPPTSTPVPPPVQTSTASNLALAETSLPIPSPSPSPSPPSTTPEPESESGDDSSGGDKRKGKGARAFRPRLDSDDPGFVDTPPTISYNFTGTAIYIFCIQPLSLAAVNGTPTNMNLSFILDNQPRGNFISNGTQGVTGFQPLKNVLSLSGLTEGPHQLVVNVGDDSVFLFDRLIYTDNSTVSPASVTAPPAAEATTTIPPQKKGNNVATFAGAIGGTVGVLSLFSLGIAISIIRRRMLAARRDRLDDEANGTGDTPPMFGPVAFVPRFFPDTIIPPDPPTYNDAVLTTNHNTTPMLASLSSGEYHLRERSYADIPPASPPPPLDELPPPPFPAALSAPIPALPPGVILPSISAENRTSSSPDLVGNGSSNSASSPESVHLLQSFDSDTTRPRSRSSMAPPEPPENSDASHHQEPAS